MLGKELEIRGLEAGGRIPCYSLFLTVIFAENGQKSAKSVA
jgi:hypothetical protein